MRSVDFESAGHQTLAFKNHLSNCLLLGMRDRQSGVLHPELGGELARYSVKADCGTAARHADHLAIAPSHSMIPSGAKCFHRGFLGCESRGITLHSICLGIAVAHLPGREDAFEKAQSEALDRVT